MQMAYAHYQKGETSIQQTEKELFHSVAKAHELYHTLLMLLLELRTFAEKRIELRKQKKRPSQEDLNPNLRFVDNALLLQLCNNAELLAYNQKHGNQWVNHQDVVKGIFDSIEASTQYLEYMESPAGDYEFDKKFLSKLVEKVIAAYEGMYTIFEEQSVYWNDEIEFIISMVVKTLKGFEEANGENEALLPEFKDEEDEEFVQRLIRKTLVNREDYIKLIKQHAKNWDFDRIANIDIVLMQIAIAEIVEFPNIAINVTLNEYIELAKFYSTAKSGLFINGILDKVVEQLINDKIINKPGKA